MGVVPNPSDEDVVPNPPEAEVIPKPPAELLVLPNPPDPEKDSAVGCVENEAAAPPSAEYPVSIVPPGESADREKGGTGEVDDPND
mmetsp:Transcript_14936/g.15047  ORF Transcript_14936/g.15047 Transcript_14936/m.15047 type:complete len:86 (+) Transcript_14936:666-923(+)